MKNNKISLETYSWSSQDIEDPFELLDTFFEYANLDYYKETLDQALLYTNKLEIYKIENPGQSFVFYTSLRSFVRCCSLLQFKDKNWKIKKPSKYLSCLCQGSLTFEEFQNPFIVFKKAFAEITLEKYEFFLCEIVHLSLSPYAEEFEYDLITPYVHLTKMLDASRLIHERGVKKLKDIKSGSAE